MLYDAPGVPFFLSPGRVANRTEKNQLVADDKIRQYDAVLPSLKKSEALHKIYQMVGRVRVRGSTSGGQGSGLGWG